jgi:GntR family transcriptional regulator
MLYCVPIDHAAPEYVYRQLAAILRAQILSGQRPPRSKLPSLAEMVDEYDVAPMTVRHAIAVLVAEGLVVTMPGRGTYVAG